MKINLKNNPKLTFRLSVSVECVYVICIIIRTMLLERN